MIPPVVLRPEALEDVSEVREHYESVSAGLGNDFVTLLEELLGRIEPNPKLYPTIWRNVRGIRLPRFPYVVYYVIRSDRVEVVAVVHGSRDPSVWRRRIR